MWRWWRVMCAGAVLASGQELPLDVIRVRIAAVSGTGPRGELELRPEEGAALRCRFDEKTWFEARKVRVDAGAFSREDLVEVLTERRAGATSGRECYARTVRLADPLARPAYPGRPVYRSVTEHIIPRESESYSGIVTAISGQQFSLRLRAGGLRQIAIRTDTRFLEAGTEVDRQRLQLNRRVFVRAGHSVEGGLEAYQVIWGEIISPR